MPRIVFWSPYENMTGNTHTAVAISTLMGMTHQVTSLLMQANFNSRKMESSFTPYEELKQSGVFNNSNINVIYYDYSKISKTDIYNLNTYQNYSFLDFIAYNGEDVLKSIIIEEKFKQIEKFKKGGFNCEQYCL